MGKKKEGKSKNPAFPEAHPTAPGGMSRKALRAELKRDTDHDPEYIDLLSWPDLISHVILSRKDKEAKAKLASRGASKAALSGNLLALDPDTLDYVFDGHAGAGPSASERWINCTASLGASRRFLETLTPNQQAEWSLANTAARQGTTAHRAAEAEALALLGRTTREEADRTLTELTFEPLDGEEYNPDMAAYIIEYTDLISVLATERGAENILIEQRVSAAVPLTGLWDGDVYEVKGSADCIALPTEEHPSVVVADLKYGNGVDVDVNENSQARIYGLGVLGMLTGEDGALPFGEDTEVTYYIAQPRLGGIKEWTETVGDLLDWRDEVLAPALTAALYGVDEGGAKFTPSEGACQFCPARGSCAALAVQREEQAKELFDVVIHAEHKGEEFPETGLLSDERLASLLTQAQGLVKIADDLKAEVQRRMYRGAQIPGFVLVNYTPPRYWRDTAKEVVDHDMPEDIRASLYKPPTLVTPTQALKILKDTDDPDAISRINEVIEVPDKRPVVAPEGDRRSLWEGRAPEDMFDIEEEA